MEMLEATRAQMSDLVYRRARHCIGEDQRTLGAVEALKNKDYATVGEIFHTITFEVGSFGVPVLQAKLFLFSS